MLGCRQGRMTSVRTGQHRMAMSLLGAWIGLAGCLGQSGPKADQATLEAARAVDEKVGGTFRDYYGEVLRLAQRYTSEPDSFRVALDALPGSHLTDEQWAAWTAPYAQDPQPLADHLEEVIAELATLK